MNYIPKSKPIYYQHQLQAALRPAYFEQCKAVLEKIFRGWEKMICNAGN